VSLDSLLSQWREDDETAPNIVSWRSLPARPAELRPIPPEMPSALVKMLQAQGIFELYSHQAEAWKHAKNGENVILATGTASGKTLSYNLPVFSALLEDPNARALYLYPTKALAQDQLSVISGQLSVISQQKELITDNCSLITGIYDGDTPAGQRKPIREKARIILSNPDMLHTGILPHHTNWADFFTHLRFVVIDELHTYRGVFGSHVANVIRRLRRVAAFYGAIPQFIMASATIGNPGELAERMIESPVHVIDQDGSARGPRHFLIYNPPVTNAALGLRKSSLLEAVRLSQDVLKKGVQSVVFARSRRSVEILLKYLTPTLPPPPNSTNLGEGRGGGIRGYRSGYLPTQRREIERGLRDGSVKLVVATTALELGIDIGGLGAAILVGYPGTIASARQQSGRAGRGLSPAAAILIASALPLDQFVAHHPEFLFERSPEQALVNPDHLLILLNHLRCAMFELPFAQNEGFGRLPAENVAEFLQFLADNGEAHHSGEKFFWMVDAYPAATVSLRSASPETVTLQITADERPTAIGTVDGESALWMAHPGAIYLHEAQSYFVESLDLEQKIARLKPIESDYFTEPLHETSIQVHTVTQKADFPAGEKAFGDIQVTTKVVGYRKLRWYSREILGQEPLDLPPTDLQTTGYWLTLSDRIIDALRDAGAWTNDPNDYGPEWPSTRDRVRARDGYRCQVCGAAEGGSRQHDVHHKVPFRSFVRNALRNSNAGDDGIQSPKTMDAARAVANRLDNLVTLCRTCHRKVEQNVRIRSGLAGLGYVLGQLAPLFLMCDPGDLGTHIEPEESSVFERPTVVLYDLVPAGIGFSEKLFEIHSELLQRALEVVRQCPCEDGCPACSGPGGENGGGGKAETLELLKALTKS
jgi:DEAD/DEAH box helicase domain-containing protein